jgi:hypothetical protein
VVATISAFGIIADVCFPHRTVEAPGLPGYSGFVPATRQINGEPALSALCYEPAEADNPHYDHVPELLRADSSPEDHSSLLVNRNAVCFAKSMVADGLVASDEDGDGRRYCVDNCPKVANPDQLDSDSDGYGNRCDADFNNNGVVDSQDGARLKATFGSNAFPERDLNGNGIVDSQDGAILKSMFGKAPGPSGTAY